MSVRPLAIAFLSLCALAASASEALPLLTTARQVRALSPEESLRRYPVRLQGVITYYEPSRWLAFLQDETCGIYVELDTRTEVSTGSFVEITGVTGPGIVGRLVQGQSEHGRILPTLLGRAPLPAPTPLDLEAGEHADLDAQWIVVSGTVSNITERNGRAVLQITDGERVMRVVVPGFFDSERLPFYLDGLKVHAQGVLGVGSEHGAGSDHLYTPTLNEITIDPSSTAERFRAPEPAYRTLVGSVVVDGQLCRVRGQVSYFEPGRGFFLDTHDAVDWKSVLWIQTSQPVTPRLGEWMEAAGHSDVLDLQPALRNSVVRSLGPGAELWPYQTDGIKLLSGDLNGKLMKVEAKLASEQPELEKGIWIISAGASLALAKLAPAAGALPTFPPGSRVSITAVVLQKRTPGLEPPPAPFSYVLLMRKPSDALLLAPPSWLEDWRIRRLLGGTLAIAALGAIWAFSLHRKVKRQTEIIRRHVADEAVHQERARIARDLHDEIGSNLGSLALLSQMAQDEFHEPPPVRAEFGEIHRIARKSFDALRDIVWLTAHDGLTRDAFEKRLRDAADSLLAGVAHEIAIDLSALPDPTPPDFARHLLLILKEALHNAVRHAHARRIVVNIRASHSSVELQVIDDGCGFSLDAAAESAGLPGMRERAVMLKGLLEIASQPGSGTRIALHIPMQTLEAA